VTDAAGAAFRGAVLCGGASRRMGRDKALLPVGGVPMAVRVADALRDAGATDVVAVGGDAGALAALGLRVVPDDEPGAGPLAAIVTALGAAPEPPGAGRPDVPQPGPVPVLVVACDLVAPSPAAMRATVAALVGDPAADVAVPDAGGRPQWAHAAWHPRVRPALATRLRAGERAVHRGVAAAGLRVVPVAGLADAALADADTPADLPGEPPRPE
jgi:molybdopterin-guanine dinucleotide biosynthesis protein A